MFIIFTIFFKIKRKDAWLFIMKATKPFYIRVDLSIKKLEARVQLFSLFAISLVISID